ncbi:MAG: NAD(P)H-quinone oxidoreductase [Pyrinomonadaceae bacterium]
MKSVVIEEFGPEFKLAIRETEDPQPPVGNQVLVRVHAAGLNRADLLQARGLYPPPAGYSPERPGLEFAGEIAAVGDAVSGWSTGDRVFGITAGEAQSELLLADASLLARTPNNLDYVTAAAIPEAFITAHDAVVTQGQLAESETLLIHAVGSGVGLAGLQIAKAAGAFVIGTSRTVDKLDRCKAFGLDVPIVPADGANFAEQVIDATDGRGADVILDLVGGGYFAQNLASLAPRGRLVLVGLTSGRTAEIDLGMILQKRARVIGTVLRSRTVKEKADATRSFADEVIPLLAAGRVTANIDRVFPMSDVHEAYRYLESNVSFGKVVLEF